MIHCYKCDTYLIEKSEYCVYCGKVFYKNIQYFLILGIRSMRKKLAKTGKTFPFRKNEKLCRKIDQEIKRINDIELLLKNIKDEQLIFKIQTVIVQISGYIDSLIKCRIDIEYLRISTSINTFKFESKSMSAKELMDYCDEKREDFDKVFSLIYNEYKRDGLKDNINQKKTDLDKLIENASLSTISSIISNATVVKESEIDFGSDYQNLEKNIDTINYEIDRLSAELSM